MTPASSILTAEQRTALASRLFNAVTTIIDEEAILGPGVDRKNLLADCGDFRAPMGLALAHLIGFERTGAVDLRAACLTMMRKSQAALGRIDANRAVLTSTQLAAFGALQTMADKFFDTMQRAADRPGTSASAGSLSDKSFGLAVRIFNTLTAMLDLERSLPGSLDRKQLVAKIVGARGPLAQAFAYLQDYVTSGRPSSRRLFMQSCARVGAEIGILETLAGSFCVEQAHLFPGAKRDWRDFEEASRETLKISDVRLRFRKGGDGFSLESGLVCLATLAPIASVSIAQAISSHSYPWALASIIVATSTIALYLLMLRYRLYRPLNRLLQRLDSLSRCDELDTPISVRLLPSLSGATERVRLTLFDLNTALNDAVVDGRSQTVERRRSMLAVADEFETTVSQIVAAMGTAAQGMRHTAETMASTSAETASRNALAAEAAGQAATGVEGVASTADDLSASVKEISRQSDASALLTAQAAEETIRLNTIMSELKGSVQAINEVTSMISQVAHETNLLALNATIEAARAGTAGRGFAVVASEVKGLSAQTAGQTKVIGTLIQRINACSNQAVTAVADISERISRLANASHLTAVSVRDQETAMREITCSASQAALGTKSVKASIEDVAVRSETTGATADRVFAAATGLAADNDRLNKEVVRFLAMVKAA